MLIKCAPLAIPAYGRARNQAGHSNQKASQINKTHINFGGAYHYNDDVNV